MYKIKVLSVGKTKEKWLEEALQEYLKRLKPYATFEFSWAKDDEQLLKLALKEPHLICLDASGKMLSSEEFSVFLCAKLEQAHSRLAFGIGGAEGLPQQLKQHSHLVSLSRLTFTHQLTRLVLIEQIYRAFEIAKGTQYHK